MNGGNWVPISKASLSELPKDRPYTRLEAMFSVTLDYDQAKPVTVRGYAALWQWSRGKVERFLDDIGVVIGYPEDTGKKQNQGGPPMIPPASHPQTKNGQIKIIDSKWLSGKASHTQIENEPPTGRPQSTTKDPNPKPLKDSSDSALFFQKLWEVYPRKDGRKEAERHFHATVKTEADQGRINLALGAYLDHIEREGTAPKFIKTGKVWFNNWQDWIPEEESDAA